MEKKEEGEGGAAEGGEAAAAAPPKHNDAMSVFVRGVTECDARGAAADFKPCGEINRITIVTDKYTNRPKGIAYIEFEDQAGRDNALLLHESIFRGRVLGVTEKRTNQPGFGRGRGRGYYRGRGRGRGRGYSRGGWRGRGRSRGYNPYY